MKNFALPKYSAILAALTIFFGPPALAQKITIHYQPVAREIVERRLRTAGSNDAQREQTLKELFQDAGCRGEHLTEQPVKHERVPNLVCAQPGTTDGVIIVGGHMDHVKAGQGVVDDWSGASLLPTLFESLQQEPRRHTFIFVGFTNEEDGLVGSRFYLKQLTPEQKSKISAMVNLECLGVTPTKVWASHADAKLLNGIASIALSMHLPLTAVNVDGAGDDDADSFRARKIPTLTIHSLTQDTWSIIHSPRDNFSAINLDNYYNSYSLIAAYLAYLDSVL